MRSMAVTAILLGVAHVAIGEAAAAMPAARTPTPADALGGGAGVKLARAGATPFLEVPATRQSALLPVGEGGEGGRGRWRARGYPYGYGYGWGPPPGYYYAPPPPPRVYRPPPPVYFAPQPYYYAPPPPYFYAPAPGITLQFRF